MAKAVASESYFSFLAIKGPEIFSKYVGDSEKAIRDIFTKAKAKAQAQAPCVVFFDEIDAICGKRSKSGGGNQVQDRVLI
jgi:SpoVK/Ycf46/Vps4 family AAA+-type ATPase